MSRASVVERLVFDNRSAFEQRIIDELQIALALDDNDADDASNSRRASKLNFNEHDKAVYHQERALSLNPNSDQIVVQQGEVLTCLCRPEEESSGFAGLMRLNPYHPERFWSHLGRKAQYSARVYADAIASYSKLTAPDHTHHAFLAASSAQFGNRTAAGAHAREVLQREPAFTAQAFCRHAAPIGTQPMGATCARALLGRRGCRTRGRSEKLWTT